MASSTVAKRMREEATCSICLALMAEPLSISCGHSYCQVCITGFISSLSHTQVRRDMLPCPQCRSPFHRASLRPNKQLGSLIEAIKELEQAMSCDEHGEELHLFCEDEGQLLCWRCERASQHRGHATALVEDVCPGYKEKLQKAVTHLRQLEEECANQQAFTAKLITKWNEEIETKKQKIQSDFRSLHSFLQLEEKSHLRRLENEKEGTLRSLQKRQAALVSKSLELESHIQELEDRCQGSAQRLLQDVKGTLSRSWAVKLETPEAPSLEIRTVCNVSKLYFDVKRLLKSYQVSVTLDPDTAHRELILSTDQRQVTRGCPQENLDASPSRFTVFPCVLGREGFTSGRHYFEVDVGEGIAWDLGVCMENVRRDTSVMRMPQTGFWAIRLCTKDGYVALTSPHTLLHLQEQPLLVGVFLDCEAEEVSFYNMTTASHIFTFPKVSSSVPLRPYFQVYRCSPLFLPPPEE